jgi:hypothetical protein
MRNKVCFSFLLSCSIALVLVGGVFPSYGLLRQSNLSDRAKQYIGDKKRTYALEWISVRERNDDGSRPTIAAKKSHTDECYTIGFPYEIMNVLNTGLCSRRFFLKKPHGEVTVVQRFVPTMDLKDVPDVLMRRTLRDKYRESTGVYNGATYVVFSRTEAQNYEKTAFRMMLGSMVAITYIAPGPRDVIEKDFASIMNSFVCRFDNCYPSVSAASNLTRVDNP